MLKLDLTRATSEGLPSALSKIPGQEAVALRRQRAAEVARKLLDGQEAGHVGFARLDQELWGIPGVLSRARELRALGDTLLVLGIGGSALGARALRDALSPAGRGLETQPQLVVLDSLDPGVVRRTLTRLDPARTLVAAVSKSGGTLETVSLLKVAQAWLSAACPADWAQRMTLVTDPNKGAFRELASSLGLATLPVPADVGGRFSVLTAVGMLPAAFLGLNVEAFFSGAQSSGSVGEAAEDPAWDYAAAHDAWWEAGATGSALMSYSERLSSFGAWFQQLWAESLGKRDSDGHELGWTPLALRGPADQHSLLQLFQDGPRDKLVTMLRVEDSDESLVVPASLPSVGADLAGLSLAEILRAEEAGTVAALVESGRPVIDLTVSRLDECGLGALFFFFQRAAAYAGLLWDIDPFDQPGVEAGKRYASAMLGRDGFDVEAARIRNVLDGRD